MRGTAWHLAVKLPRCPGLVTFSASREGARRIASAIARRLRVHVALEAASRSALADIAGARPRHQVELLSGRLVALTAMLDRAAASKVAQAFADVLKESTRLRVAGERRAPAKHRTARARSKPSRSATRRRVTKRQATSRRSRRNPSDAELRQADRKFREWHGFGPQHVSRIRMKPVPHALVRLGAMPRIYYESDKWDGKLRTYVHHTSKPHPVLYCSPHGDRFFIHGGRVRATDRGLIN